MFPAFTHPSTSLDISLTFGITIVERHCEDLDKDLAIFGLGLGGCGEVELVEAIEACRPLLDCRHVFSC